MNLTGKQEGKGGGGRGLTPSNKSRLCSGGLGRGEKQDNAPLGSESSSSRPVLPVLCICVCVPGNHSVIWVQALRETFKRALLALVRSGKN